MAPDESVVQIGGPWTHRAVHAGGTRFHVVEAGEGPLVLFLHGFPQFWWTWRHQLTSLPKAGYRAVAADLRGYGGSDKPPRGYDLPTLAADAAGLIRALGETGAIVVGHDWGGLLAWTMAVLDPKCVRRLVVVSSPHPLRMRSALLTDPFGQLKASRGALGYQLPVLPELRLRRHEASLVGRMLDEWSRPGWPEQEESRTYREAFRIPAVAHSALEYHRWFGRSQLRPDGRRYARAMRTEVEAPTLHLHGALDPRVLPRTAQGSSRYVAAPYRWRLFEGAGHFPHEEIPDVFDTELLGWLADPEPDR
ncbi:alpha/beta hydrolase [Nonomuraea sp. K274]|uniref:Alpha/beta hydrolase n=1 Tax=Nonomuraea cypriaca TaxID=1187855 RepID=A0A931AQN6_9ACTN|nr:alpha/beta hydrolase [Nonomuraea cypriaca]MBF8193172.1 alpha/beta hydrolase [Nonomuraea cypriaca]